jgi:hypothetical protein
MRKACSTNAAEEVCIKFIVGKSKRKKPTTKTKA